MASILICVGKLKQPALESLEKDYLKRIRNFTVTEVKAYGDDVDREGSAVIKQIEKFTEGKKAKIILLSEKGQLMNSIEFAQFVSNCSNNKTIFIIGGASGFSKELWDLADDSMSLSLMTFPHRLARIIFVEQYFRAQTINDGHPYNK